MSIKDFFENLWHPGGTVSSKRVMGIIGALNLYAHTWYAPITGEDLKTHSFLIGGLLGIGAVVDIFKAKNKDKGNEK